MNKQKIKIIKQVMKLLEKDFGFCEYKSGTAKFHYTHFDCPSCRAGLVYSFLENWINLENDK